MIGVCAGDGHKGGTCWNESGGRTRCSCGHCGLRRGHWRVQNHQPGIVAGCLCLNRDAHVNAVADLVGCAAACITAVRITGRVPVTRLTCNPCGCGLWHLKDSLDCQRTLFARCQIGRGHTNNTTGHNHVTADLCGCWCVVHSVIVAVEKCGTLSHLYLLLMEWIRNESRQHLLPGVGSGCALALDACQVFGL